LSPHPELTHFAASLNGKTRARNVKMGPIKQNWFKFPNTYERLGVVGKKREAIADLPFQYPPN